MPKRIEYKENEVYTFRIELTGRILKQLEARADILKRSITNESSFLICELLTEFFEPGYAPSSVKSTDLISDNWKNQSEVTEKTLKTK